MMGDVVKETPTVFAQRIGKVKSYITQLKADDRLVTEIKGKRWVVLVEASLARIEATRDHRRDDVVARHADARDGGDDAAELIEVETNASYQQSRAIKERYMALQAKAQYEQDIGKLVDADVVKRAGADMGVLLRTSLENLQDQLSSELASETDPARIYTILGEHFEYALNEVSRKLTTAVNI